MKKILALIITTILLSVFTLSCYAEVTFNTAYDLIQMWARSDSYPDYVCGVWLNDGSHSSTTISVLDTEDGNRGKEEILGLIEDDSSVTFTYGEYSRNYLTDVQDELLKLFKTNEEHGLISTALDEYNSRISLGILKEYNGNEKTEQMLLDLTAEYGDIFTVNYCDEPIEELLITAPVTETVPVQKKPHYLSTILLILLLLSCVTFMVIRKRRAFVLKTNNGETLSVSTPLTDKQVANIIKTADVDYPCELDNKIMDAIDKSD